MERKKPCIRCLLRDLDKEESYQKFKLYLEQFDESIRTADEEYERRLQLCKRCECLREGICIKCGCYVEARALRKQAHCPHEDIRW